MSQSPREAPNPHPTSISKRLPPNPRRRKVLLEQRKRVVQACNACNVRRVKCSGSQPCSNCSFTSRACEYPPQRGKNSSSKVEYQELQERCAILERCLEEAVPSEKSRNALMSKWSKPAGSNVQAPSTHVSNEDEDKTGDGRVLQDPDGHVRYLGESSGAAFMDRLREFVFTVLPFLSDTGGVMSDDSEDTFTSLVGRYHTHDSKPLILPDVDPYEIPSPEEISKLLGTFRLHAQDGIGRSFGGIYYWGNLWELEDQARRYALSPDLANDRRMLANLNSAMALACQFDPTQSLFWDLYPGQTYFARARILLGNPLEDTNPMNMRILSLMGHFMLGLYRRDAAYSYIGHAGRTAAIHGLHKGWMIEGQGEVGEQCKREFWNTYILDRFLSCLMGRPAMIPHESVDVALPVDIPNSTLPPAAGLRAHVQLSMIMDEIVNKLYGATSQERSILELMPTVAAVIQKLSSWLADLPPSLQLGKDTGRRLVIEKPCLLLHMMYNQLLILCTRPLLFVAVKHTFAARYTSRESHKTSSRMNYAKSCAEAARRNANLCRELSESSQGASFSTLDYHYAFTAGIALQLSRLEPEVSIQDDEGNVNFLIQYLSELGDQGNESARDCAKMIIQFGAVVSRVLIDYQKSPGSIPGPGSNIKPTIAPNQSAYQPNKSIIQPFQVDYLNSDLFTEDQSMAYRELFSWF